MENHQQEPTLNTVMKSSDHTPVEETSPVWVFGSIVIRDPETQNPIAKIPG